jgi:hypothetical protein
MLHPGSSLYIQDRVRGENRELNYEEVLAEHKRFEQDNIDKFIGKTRDHYNEQIKQIEQSLIESKAEIETLRNAQQTQARLSAEEIEKAAAEREDALRHAEQGAVDQHQLQKKARAKERRRAERLIANVGRAEAKWRRWLRGFLLVLLAALIVAKLLVEKVWSTSLTGYVSGMEIPYWIVVAVGLALLLVVMEAAGGILGDIKIPFVRNWLAGRLRASLESDQEYDEFQTNEFGLDIEQDGFDFRIVERDGHGGNPAAVENEAAETG